MTNRYVTKGIIEDLREGKRVAVLASATIAPHVIFNSVMRELDDREVGTAHRANGQERIVHVSGGALTLINSPEQIPGVCPDTLVLAGTFPEWIHSGVAYLVDRHRVELIRL